MLHLAIKSESSDLCPHEPDGPAMETYVRFE